jgi:hypothetical protein
MCAVGKIRSILLLASLAIPAALSAEQGFGKLDPAPPTGHTVDEIIQKFGQQESAFQKAREQYTFRQSVKVDTVDEDTSKVDGEWQQVTDIVFTPDGRRSEHVVFAPANTLERIILQQQDLDDLERGFPFVLTAEQLPKFNITYMGRQKVDELDTYVFSVVPKVITVKDREFEGKVWVDQQEIQIVLINGKIVPDDFREGHENMSPPFSTYYEQVDGKYWFPTYTKADAEFHIPATKDALADDIHVKAVVKYTDYKQFHATSRILFNGEDITNNHPSDTQPPASQPAEGGKQPGTK